MKLAQIAAGKEPPVTLPTPPVPFRLIGSPFLLDLVIMTAAEICGVYPTNHALLLSSAVPVLPAAGRPVQDARVPVPEFTTD